MHSLLTCWYIVVKSFIRYGARYFYVVIEKDDLLFYEGHWDDPIRPYLTDFIWAEKSLLFSSSADFNPFPLNVVFSFINYDGR